jgi:pectin methylesterase-like acyl-CoA thioesterase
VRPPVCPFFYTLKPISDPRADGYWYVIDRSLITGVNKNGTSYLGRPWRNYARVVFQENYLDANINPAGWSIWSTSCVLS